MSVSTDIEIRTALHQKTLRRFHECPHTLVVNELALVHASARVDIAVINGCVHGYEIKSAADSLSRLPRQISLYEGCLERLTIVCAPKHIEGVRKIVPSWCGIIQATKGARGAIEFRSMRPSQTNKNVKSEQLAHLLWRQEAMTLLSAFDLSAADLRKPRKELYKEISARFTVSEITAYIKKVMVGRPISRGLPVHASYGG
jgi:hypothetical protein